MDNRTPQVGAPDPELDNSPIVDEWTDDDEPGARELEHDEPGRCFFNGTAYPVGAYVQSGSELLQCAGRGVWLRRGEREGPR